MANPLRDPDDSYDFPTVPRFAELGKQDNQDANTTLGDRFFVSLRNVARHILLLNCVK